MEKRDLLKPLAPFYYVVYRDHRGESGPKAQGESDPLFIVHCAGSKVFEDKDSIIIAMDIWPVPDPYEFYEYTTIAKDEIIVIYELKNPDKIYDKTNLKKFQRLLEQHNSNY